VAPHGHIAACGNDHLPGTDGSQTSDNHTGDHNQVRATDADEILLKELDMKTSLNPVEKTSVEETGFHVQTLAHSRILMCICVCTCVNPNQYEFEQIDPQARVLNYCFQKQMPIKKKFKKSLNMESSSFNGGTGLHDENLANSKDLVLRERERERKRRERERVILECWLPLSPSLSFSLSFSLYLSLSLSFCR